MMNPDVIERAAREGKIQPHDEYNFRHFQFKHLLEDATRTVKKEGIAPGELAPDFTLPLTDGSSVQLSDFRGKPLVLHFGSFT